MINDVASRRLFGRERETAVLGRLVSTARDGHGAVLVVYGDPGVGKTALLEGVSAAGHRLVAAVATHLFHVGVGIRDDGRRNSERPVWLT